MKDERRTAFLLDKEVQHDRLAASPDAADREDLFSAEKHFQGQGVVSFMGFQPVFPPCSPRIPENERFIV